MIKKKTVFVLGAGASMPYGLPSGAQLRGDICAPEAKRQAKALVDECAMPPGLIDEFKEAFLRSSQPSIDAFLAKRPAFAEVGKLAIAYQLCHRESGAAVIRPEDDADHWYQHLWESMSWDVHDAAGLARNAVRFVTFNYDRSLEFFLHESTKHSYGLVDVLALRAWQPIPILHVYGSLGAFHYKGDHEARPYKAVTDRATLRLAASALKVIPEAREDDAAFKTAREWFGWADTICFLGFGFDRLNMERLGLADVLGWLKRNHAPTPGIVASVFGKTDQEISTITANHFSAAASYTTLKERNLMTLRHSGVLD